MVAPVRSSDAITPTFLTDVLRERGVLPAGEVVGVAKECRSPFLSEVCTLRLTYSEDAPPSAPRNLFFKLMSNEEHGKREIQLYQSLMHDNHKLPIPTVYYAVQDKDSGAVNLLLEDLSETHVPLEHELPPTEKQCYQIMGVLARIHSFWWESPELASIADEESAGQSLTAEYHENIEAYRSFAEFLGDRLLPSRRAIYEHVIAIGLPVKLARFAGQKNITLSHGDAHAWNFVYPKNDDALPVLLDWEAFGINLPTFDPAYFMAVFWHPSRRGWLEQPLLHYYYDQLVGQGILGYSWEECWRDYRLSVIDLVFQPVWWWKTGLPAFLWWYRLERIMMAFEDLECMSLLR